jgi:hypothetical protein
MRAVLPMIKVPGIEMIFTQMSIVQDGFDRSSLTTREGNGEIAFQANG